MSKAEEKKEEKNEDKKDARPAILMIVGDYGEDYEIMVPFQLLLSVGYRVDAVCPDKKKGDKIKTSIHDFEGDQTYSEKVGHNFVLTESFKNALDNVKIYKALVLPGGRAPEYLSINKDVIKLVSHFTTNKIPIASVCHGPLILASIDGYLKDKKCTSYAACGPIMKSTKCQYIEPNKTATTVIVSDCKTLVTGPAWPCHDIWLNKFLTISLNVKFNKCKGKILIIAGDYVEDYEIMCPFQMLQTYGYNVDVICPDKKKGDIIKTAVHDFEGDQTYSEKRGHNFLLNATFDDLFNEKKLNDKKISEYIGLYIPGGRAPEYLSINKNVLNIVEYFIKNNKPIGVICHGVLLLAAIKDSIKGKEITSYPACKPVMIACGAKYKDAEPITKAFIDEKSKLVSSGAWPAHPETISAFVKQLGGSVTL